MINPADIIDNLVTKLKAVPDLVALLNDDASRIVAYKDRYPKESSLALAIAQTPSPGMLVYWTGTRPSRFGEMEVWSHNVGICLRCAELTDDDPSGAGYFAMFRAVTHSLPTGESQPISRLAIHEDCNPMDVPSMERAMTVDGLDYWEINMAFVELGDD